MLEPDEAFESISLFHSISEIMNPDAWVWWGFWINFVIEFSLRSDHIWRSSLMRPLNRFPYWILLEKWAILALEPNEEVGLTSVSEFLWKWSILRVEPGSSSTHLMVSLILRVPKLPNLTYIMVWVNLRIKKHSKPYIYNGLGVFEVLWFSNNA